LKGREPRWEAIERKLANRTDRVSTLSATDAAHLSNQISIAEGGQPRSAPAKGSGGRTGPIRPGSGAGTGAGTGTAVLDRPSQGGNRPAARPRKGKGKRKR
jgi:hypothetical protein